MISTGAQIILAFLGIFAAASLATLGWIARKVLTHDAALAVLIDQVNPPGRASLRELLGSLSSEVAVINIRNEHKDNK